MYALLATHSKKNNNTDDVQAVWNYFATCTFIRIKILYYEIQFKYQRHVQITKSVAFYYYPNRSFTVSHLSTFVSVGFLFSYRFLFFSKC